MREMLKYQWRGELGAGNEEMAPAYHPHPLEMLTVA